MVSWRTRLSHASEDMRDDAARPPARVWPTYCRAFASRRRPWLHGAWARSPLRWRGQNEAECRSAIRARHTLNVRPTGRSLRSRASGPNLPSLYQDRFAQGGGGRPGRESSRLLEQAQQRATATSSTQRRTAREGSGWHQVLVCLQCNTNTLDGPNAMSRIAPNKSGVIEMWTDTLVTATRASR